MEMKSFARDRGIACFSSFDEAQRLWIEICLSMMLIDTSIHRHLPLFSFNRS